jgi:hypothetical protein
MKKIWIMLGVIYFSFASFSAEEAVEIKKDVTGVNKEIYNENQEVDGVEDGLGNVKLEQLENDIGVTSDKDKLKEMKLTGEKLGDVNVNVEDNIEKDIMSDLNESKAKSWWKYILIGILVVAGASAL